MAPKKPTSSGLLFVSASVSLGSRHVGVHLLGRPCGVSLVPPIRPSARRVRPQNSRRGPAGVDRQNRLLDRPAAASGESPGHGFVAAPPKNTRFLGRLVARRHAAAAPLACSLTFNTVHNYAGPWGRVVGSGAQSQLLASFYGWVISPPRRSSSRRCRHLDHLEALGRSGERAPRPTRWTEPPRIGRGARAPPAASRSTYRTVARL